MLGDPNAPTITDSLAIPAKGHLRQAPTWLVPGLLMFLERPQLCKEALGAAAVPYNRQKIGFVPSHARNVLLRRCMRFLA